MKITKQFRTETAHRLQHHPGRCKNIHGHSYLFEVTLETDQLLMSGMVEDFSDLKKTAGAVIDDYDHAIVLQDDDPWVQQIPKDQRIVIYDCNPTAENMVFRIAHEIQQFYPHCRITVRAWETATSYAEYGTP